MSTPNKSFHPKDFEKKRYLRSLKILAPLKQEKAQQYAVLVFTILSLSIFGLFAINPTITTILELRRKLEDSEIVNQKLDKKISDMSALQQAYSLLDPDLPVIYNAMPKEPEVAKLLGQLQALAAEQNVTIIELRSFEVPLQTNAKTPKGNQKEDQSFEFSLVVAGTYKDMHAYLQQLTKFERVVSVISVSVDRGEGERETIPLEMTIKGKSYYQHESQ